MISRTPRWFSSNSAAGVLFGLLGIVAACSVVRAEDAKSAFPRPPEITPAVAFWTRVYADIDSNTGLVHDSRELGVVYEVLRLPRHAPPGKQQRIIRQRIRHYRRLLNRVADTPADQLSAEEQEVKRLWRPNATAARLKRAAARVRFQRGQSDRMERGLQRAAAYEDEIRGILRDKGVPEQLAALPHVESSYNPMARSKAGAAGLWQIMPATGRRYLRVNNVIDERLDPYKATDAAAQLLKHNHSVLKSWPLAITAYNHGLAGIRRAVRKSGTADIGKIIQRYNGRAFGFASRNFYPAFLAAYDVSNSRRPKYRRSSTTKVPTVVLNTYMPAAAIVEGLDVDEAALKEHNPDLATAVWEGDKRIPKSYRLRVPGTQDIALLHARMTTLEARFGHAKQVPDRLYRVQPGDNLGHIAQAHNTSVRTLVAMNTLRSSHRINAGQVLRIPLDPDTPTPKTRNGSSSISDQLAGNQSTAAETTTERLDIESSSGDEDEARPERSVSAERQMPDATTAAPAPQSLPENDDEPADENETVVIVQSDLAADPTDYLVSEDGTIEIQVGETLGHYAHWLEVATKRLRAINRMGHGQHVIVGRRLRLDLSKVRAGDFERRRKGFHAGIQNRFFEKYRISDVKNHVLGNGDNLWELSMKTYQVPLWLLRQYNPELSLDKVLSLSGSVRIPVLQLNDDSSVTPPVTPNRS